MGRRLSPETEITPETVLGSSFGVPAVEGEGSGRGFSFTNLHLPQGWEKAIPQLKDRDLQLTLKSNYAHYLNQSRLELRGVEFDSKTGVLRGVTLGPLPLSYVKLATPPSFSRQDKERGVYKALHVNDIDKAVAMLRITTAYLNFIADQIDMRHKYAYILGHSGGYSSANLILPDKVLGSEEPTTNEYYRFEFLLRAAHIAGTFGVTIRSVEFSEEGLLSFVELKEGNRCWYVLEQNTGQEWEYVSHDVDNAYQAAALHAVCASFINSLLEKQEGELA